ncbi:MAG: antitoxin, RHH family protein [Planctomycetota bacterium]
MSVKAPNLNVKLEPGLYQTLNRLARREKISLSLMARDLIKEALEIYEDMYWQKEVQKRDRTFSYKKSLSHDETWK